MHSVNLPNGVGNFTETNRNFYRDDSEDLPILIRNTGINRNPTGIQQKTAAASAASVQEKSSEGGKAKKKPEKPSSVQERPASQGGSEFNATSTEDVPGAGGVAGDGMIKAFFFASPIDAKRKRA